MKTPEGKTAFMAICGDCAHRWVVAWLPMGLHKVAALCTAAMCPLCGSGKVNVSSENDSLKATAK